MVNLLLSELLCDSEFHLLMSLTNCLVLVEECYLVFVLMSLALTLVVIESDFVSLFVTVPVGALVSLFVSDGELVV